MRARFLMVPVASCLVTLVGAALVAAPTSAETFPGPDGLIAWAGSSFGDLVVANPDGSGAHVLDPAAVSPAWSADGARLAYVCPDAAGTEKICVINADGSGRQQITLDASQDADPTWTPDGRIVFVSNRDGPALIYVMNSDGSDVTPLTEVQAQTDDAQPSVSPDGAQIVFSRNSAGSVDLWMMTIDGADEIQITNLPGAEGLANWSPDGARVIFSHDDASNIQQIFTMNPDGSDIQPLTATTEEQNFAPAFSPTGTRITFARQLANAGAVEIMVMNADGSDPVSISAGGQDDDDPTWQPAAVVPVPEPVVLVPTFTG